MTIRKANEHDFLAVFSLIKSFSLYQKTPEKVTISLEQMINEKNFFQCLIVENPDKEIVGFASFFFAYYSWSGKALYLDDLYIKEDYRNQGFGKNLLNAIIDLAKEQDCKKLRWQVSNWNINAIEFYKQMGAIIDDTEINCDLIIQ